MRKSEVIRVLQELGVRPSRKLGQNFLIDPNTLDFIVGTINPRDGDLILEVGAGTGNLTNLLITGTTKVIAVEYDVRLAAFLQGKFGDDARVQVVQADAARLDYSRLIGDRSYRCAGNLPYSSSSVIIAQFLHLENRPRQMDFLLQKEMADRLAASPGSKDYGAITVCLQVLYDVRVVRKISPTVFWPVPEVDSALIHFSQKPQIPDADSFRELSKFVRLAFSQRRKKLVTAVGCTISKDIMLDALAHVGLEKNVRAEEIGTYQYIDLIRFIAGAGNLTL